MALIGMIIATIVNPEHRPQMATVRSGVMQKAVYEGKVKILGSTDENTSL